eukprot:3603138-Prymnesium_polylepis.2
MVAVRTTKLYLSLCICIQLFKLLKIFTILVPKMGLATAVLRKVPNAPPRARARRGTGLSRPTVAAPRMRNLAGCCTRHPDSPTPSFDALRHPPLPPAFCSLLFGSDPRSLASRARRLPHPTRPRVRPHCARRPACAPRAPTLCETPRVCPACAPRAPTVCDRLPLLRRHVRRVDARLLEHALHSAGARNGGLLGPGAPAAPSAPPPLLLHPIALCPTANGPPAHRIESSCAPLLLLLRFGFKESGALAASRLAL